MKTPMFDSLQCGSIVRFFKPGHMAYKMALTMSYFVFSGYVVRFFNMKELDL